MSLNPGMMGAFDFLLVQNFIKALWKLRDITGMYFFFFQTGYSFTVLLQHASWRSLRCVQILWNLAYLTNFSKEL